MVRIGGMGFLFFKEGLGFKVKGAKSGSQMSQIICSRKLLIEVLAAETAKDLPILS